MPVIKESDPGLQHLLSIPETSAIGKLQQIDSADDIAHYSTEAQQPAAHSRKVKLFSQDQNKVWNATYIALQSAQYVAAWIPAGLPAHFFLSSGDVYKWFCCHTAGIGFLQWFVDVLSNLTRLAA